MVALHKTFSSPSGVSFGLFGGTCGIIISDGRRGEKGKKERKEREKKERKRRRKMMGKIR